MHFIYKITNKINGKIYIGETANIKTRWNAHKTAARKKDPKDYSYIHRAMNKYGFGNFVIEQIDQFPAEEEALAAEVLYIRKFDSTNKEIGYNLTEGGEGSSGYKHTEESKLKMKRSEEFKHSISGDGNPFFGKKHDSTTKNKLSEAAAKRTGSANPFFGKTHTEETRILMGLSQKGKPGRKGKYLSKSDIEDIVYKKNVLRIPYKQLAIEYGVHRKTLYKAVKGKGAYVSNNSENKQSPEENS